MAAASRQHVALLRALVINNFRLFKHSTHGNVAICKKCMASDSKLVKSNNVTSKNSTETSHDVVVDETESNDFLGVSTFQKNDVDGVRTCSIDELEIKFDIHKKPPVETVIDAPFGVIRIDGGKTSKLRPNKLRRNERKGIQNNDNLNINSHISDFSKKEFQTDQTNSNFNSKTMRTLNVSKKMGQNRIFENIAIENSFIDDQYFSFSGSNEGKQYNISNGEKDGTSTKNLPTAIKILPVESQHQSSNNDHQINMEEPHSGYFDECFFSRETVSLKGEDNYFVRNINENSSTDLPEKMKTETEHVNDSDSSEIPNSSYPNDSMTDIGSVNFFDEQYFSTSQSTGVNGTNAEIPSTYSTAPNVTSFVTAESESRVMKRNNLKSGKINDNGNVDKLTQVTTIRDIPEEVKHSTDNSSNIFKKTTRIKKEPIANIEEPKTAYDLATKLQLERKYGPMRKKSEEATGEGIEFQKLVDSKGYRILRDQVEDLRKLPSADIVQILRNSIIYDRDDIVAISKPYGLPSHGGPGVRVSVGQLLPALTRLLDPSGKSGTLHLIHRLDKETTGVMLLAKTPEVASRIHGMFHRREVVKKYWVITKGIPNPLRVSLAPCHNFTSQISSIVCRTKEELALEYHCLYIAARVSSIYLSEKEKWTENIGQRLSLQMVIKPEWTRDTSLILKKSKVPSSIAVTKYEVLATHGSCALVECEPESGIKHQIRVHLASGVNTPILGDHKYSHFTKLAPQRLPPDMLKRLGIRQSKVRHVAMHLHAKSIILPEYNNGRNVFISTRLPKFFATNMNHLKLKPPKGK